MNVDDTVEMLPKSRRALTIQEIAALARSSLHGECDARQLKRKSKEKKRKKKREALRHKNAEGFSLFLLQVFHRW